MICPTCKDGKGFIAVAIDAYHFPWSVEPVTRFLPCPDCNGSGIAYCCDGEDVDLAQVGRQSE